MRGVESSHAAKNATYYLCDLCGENPFTTEAQRTASTRRPAPRRSELRVECPAAAARDGELSVGQRDGERAGAAAWIGGVQIGWRQIHDRRRIGFYARNF